MNEICEAVVQLVREGGQAAIYIVIVHYVVGLVKFVIGMGLVGYVASKLYGIIKYGIDKSKNFRD